MRTLIFLPLLERYSDAALLILRIAVGAFLIWGGWDNIASIERMNEFVSFLRKFGFPAPAAMARLSVWAQFFVGISFITGFATRWAGLICAMNFVIAIAMVDRFAGMRGAFGSLCLVLIGLYLATKGAGQLSADAVLNRSHRSVNAGK